MEFDSKVGNDRKGCCRGMIEGGVGFKVSKDKLIASRGENQGRLTLISISLKAKKIGLSTRTNK